MDKIEIVENCLKGKKVAIGFSGGADSTLLAYLSSKVAQDTLLITIDNHLMPSGFIENTQNTSERFDVKHEIVDINFYEDDSFTANLADRCYNCRNLMYATIIEVAKAKGFDYVCDGNNISDLVNDRPGILITYKNSFNTPFIEARLTSKEIHEYLDENDIAYSRSTTCLATRIPTNTPVSSEKIERIGKCEDYISDTTGCEIVKVRDLESIGIIEVDNVNEIICGDKFKQINDELNRQGFGKVVLNLAEIDDNEYISIDFAEGCFSYQLPFTVNLENTKKEIGENGFEYPDRIELGNISIYESGLIEGHDLNDYETALERFMDALVAIRRNV